jgi:hypothetical protein
MVAAPAEAPPGGGFAPLARRAAPHGARDEAEDLPRTAQVHDFLDLLDGLERRR